MKPAPFTHYNPTATVEALQLLREFGADAQLLAGGQSLIPALNMRLARPAVLIDLNRISALNYIRLGDHHLAIGAMTRHRTVETSPLVAKHCPLLAEATRLIGHVQIRNRGTIGGSLAHADPAAELPAVAVAVGARLIAAGADGRRREIEAADFFAGWFATALEPDEMLIEIRVPLAGPGSGQAFMEVSRRAGDFAICGVAAAVVIDDDGRIADAHAVLTGVGPQPIMPDVAAVLHGLEPDLISTRAVAARVIEAVDPEDDIHATAAYRRHLSGVLAGRALVTALARAKAAKGEMMS